MANVKVDCGELPDGRTFSAEGGGGTAEVTDSRMLGELERLRAEIRDQFADLTTVLQDFMEEAHNKRPPRSAFEAKAKAAKALSPIARGKATGLQGLEQVVEETLRQRHIDQAGQAAGGKSPSRSSLPRSPRHAKPAVQEASFLPLVPDPPRGGGARASGLSLPAAEPLPGQVPSPAEQQSPVVRISIPLPSHHEVDVESGSDIAPEEQAPEEVQGEADGIQAEAEGPNRRQGEQTEVVQVAIGEAGGANVQPSFHLPPVEWQSGDEPHVPGQEQQEAQRPAATDATPITPSRGPLQAASGGVRRGGTRDLSTLRRPPRAPGGQPAWGEGGMAAAVSTPAMGLSAIHCRTASPVGADGLDGVRRHVEGLLVRGVSQPQEEEVLERKPCVLLVIIATGIDMASSWALCLGGVLPWSRKRLRLCQAYQLALLLLNAGIVAAFVQQAHHSELGAAFSLGDVVLASGALLGLLAAGAPTGSDKLQKSLAQLAEDSLECGFDAALQQANAIDALVTAAVWMAFMAHRIGSTSRLGFGLAQLPLEDTFRLVAVAFASAELSLLVVAVLKVTRGMAGQVDSFCTRFWTDLDYVDSVSEWNVVQASVRRACSAVEWSFAVVQSTLVLLALAVVFDLKGLVGMEWAVSCSGILILSLCQVLLRAASVTDACKRLPQLVNATAFSGEAVDSERTYLVDYITASAAGFYLFNVRLDAGIVIKVFHYTGLFAFTLARLVVPTGL